MKSLIEIIREAESKRTAIGHFNISDLVALKAIFSAAYGLKKPVIIGTSEGEGDFIGRKQAAALIKSLREEHDFPIFINADHTHSFEKVKEAVSVGYDAILFDAGKLDFENNVKETKQVVEYVKSKNPSILVEGELGYIGSSSKILKEIPEGAAIKPEDLTSPEEALYFIKETGIDMLAPAVGNLHGMFKGAANPNIDIGRIQNIRTSGGIPLVLHGGSGIVDSDFVLAIEAGISIIHINTEIRLAWRQGVERGLNQNPEEITPYKILPEVVRSIEEIVSKRLNLFSKNWS